MCVDTSGTSGGGSQCGSSLGSACCQACEGGATLIRRAKYGNKKTIVDGIKFDSKREAARYSELKLLEKSGQIEDLKLQVAYQITIAGVKVCKYVADFTYYDRGQEVVEDVKGMKTAIYNLKKKLMKACHGIVINEVK